MAGGDKICVCGKLLCRCRHCKGGGADYCIHYRRKERCIICRNPSATKEKKERARQQPYILTRPKAHPTPEPVKALPTGMKASVEIGA